MATCKKCGKEVPRLSLDIITGACEECQKAGARPASLGCGTLIVIAIIIGIVTSGIRSDVSEMERGLSDIESAVERLEEANSQQLEEIRALREALEAGGS